MWRSLKTGRPDAFNRPEDKAREAYLDYIESIQANSNLTQSAKLSLRARAYQQTKDRVDGFATEAAEARVHGAKKSVRAAFGTGDLAARARQRTVWPSNRLTEVQSLWCRKSSSRRHCRIC
jgi:hypothetical protein